MNQETYIKELEGKIEDFENILQEIAAPIIPSIIPETILVPMTGKLTKERLEKIRLKILDAVQKEDIDAAIIDFTGINQAKIADLGYGQLASEVSMLNQALKLMGVQSIYVGFSPALIRDIINSGIQFDVRSHTTFKTALQYLMDQKKIRFTTVE